ncbi:hypothetical protein PHET_02041 [Paragonimus heterotremus]|uniref:Uncharacterized protein n=1 Tax=Paragonimus heterotremus TaxID=100268 RepID=A0A8J4T510_9TREM|nr:hypothetical protein PHET_02041 [Paragonimus heterotremus]
MHHAMWNTYFDSSDESQTEESESSQIDDIYRYSRIDNVIRLLNMTHDDSRKFTSLMVAKPEKHVLSYVDSESIAEKENMRASADMLTFVQATSVIMGMDSSLTPSNYIRWRRKLTTWLDINSLQKRYIKKHEIHYHLVPGDFQPQSRCLARSIWQRIRRQLKTKRVILNNREEHDKLFERLEALRMNRFQNAAQKLTSEESKRVWNMKCREKITEEDFKKFNLYLGLKQHESAKQEAFNKNPITKLIMSKLLPAIKIAPPTSTSLEHLRTFMIKRLKELIVDTPQITTVLETLKSGRTYSSFEEKIEKDILDTVESKVDQSQLPKMMHTTPKSECISTDTVSRLTHLLNFNGSISSALSERKRKIAGLSIFQDSCSKQLSILELYTAAHRLLGGHAERRCAEESVASTANSMEMSTGTTMNTSIHSLLIDERKLDNTE